MAMKTSDLFVIVLVVVLLYWLSVTDDDTQPTFTLQNKCELLLKNRHDVPKHVIDYCRNILEKENDD